MNFVEELELVLPADLPNRARVIEKSGEHLTLIVAANEHLNLTRITSPRDAAVKHVLDSVLTWRLFAGAKPAYPLQKRRSLQSKVFHQ